MWEDNLRSSEDISYYTDVFANLYVVIIDCSCDDTEKLPAELSDDVKNPVDELIEGLILYFSQFSTL